MAQSVRIRIAGNFGHALCLCPGCCPRGGGGKAAVKRKTARAVRRSERREIETED
jgi:hypothetical protein